FGNDKKECDEQFPAVPGGQPFQYVRRPAGNGEYLWIFRVHLCDFLLRLSGCSNVGVIVFEHLLKVNKGKAK
ncbi:TPA: hypothetical protein ACXZU0_005084, partial [Salmonella enterica]